jgi:hypothetical protein
MSSTRTEPRGRDAHRDPPGPPTGPRAGYALASVMILLFVLGIIGMAFLSLAGGETRMSHRDMQSQRAFWLAEGGKERALRWMKNQSTPPIGDTPIYTNALGPQIAGFADRGTYSVTCVVDTSATWSETKAFVLDAVGTVGNGQRRIRDRIRMVCFAQYAYFSDNEVGPGGEDIWFFTGDVLQGKIHSNGTIKIYGNPQFLGAVTSHSDHMEGNGGYTVTGPGGWPVGGNNPTFAQGFQLNVPTIALPTGTTDLKDAAQNHGGLYLANASTIELGRRADGTVSAGWLRYQNTSPPGAWGQAQISTLNSGVVYCNADTRVSGILDGELTIGSHRNIYIVDDIRYQASNATGTPNPGCNDLLGLVSEQNVIYAYNTANATDLRVDAVMMALNTSIEAESYDQYAPRGTLTVWGGLIQKYRGPVGQAQNGVITHGYLKDYHYDPRVTARTPPGFPLTGQYEEVAWTETWDAAYPF